MRLPTLDTCPTLVLSANTILYPCTTVQKKVSLPLPLNTGHVKPNPRCAVPLPGLGKVWERFLWFLMNLL